MSARRDSAVPERAMVLAAGLGKRMRPLTDMRPKALVEVMGRALIDHALDRLAALGVAATVVNIHHFAQALEAHLTLRKTPGVIISDERRELLDTGGGIVQALPLLGTAPFLLVNSDSLWIEGANSNLERLARHFDPVRMDALLMLAPAGDSIGYDGRGDYNLAADGRLQRRASAENAPFVYAGGAMIAPALFAGAPENAFPLSLLFDRAEQRGRLFGLTLQGTFLHVGTPAAIALAEHAIRRQSEAR
jgi:MurNAc alpha-1-phosphate uridylyltransferase